MSVVNRESKNRKDLNSQALNENFIAQSKKFLNSLNSLNMKPKFQTQYEEPKAETIQVINGVPYFESLNIFNREVEVLADCVAIRGDHFYLKKGEIVKVKSVTCEYAYIFYRGFKGYFPCCFFNIDPIKESK